MANNHEGIRGGMVVSIKEWYGYAFCVVSVSRGRIKVTMLGDDRVRDVATEDCMILNEEDYCDICGKMDCSKPKGQHAK